MAAGPNPPAVGAATAPLLGTTDPQRIVAWQHGRGVAAGQFLAHVQRIAEQLPAAPAVVNLCQDRYAFLVAFGAALVRGQTSLLPPSRAPGVVREIMVAHPGSHALSEIALEAPPPAWRCLPDLAAPTPTPAGAVRVPDIATNQVAVIGYTSGSTGAPQASVKTWGSYVASTAGNLHMLRQHLPEPFHVLATVPAQHMYGMETSVLLPLLGAVGVHAARPLLPADVASCLAQLPAPRVLVTTPVHLRALLASGQALPALAAMVSATAPLARALAQQAEQAFQAPLLEVFGSTETCVFASRRTAREEEWTGYPGVRVQPAADGTRIEAPQLTGPVTLADIVRPTRRGFVLLGRSNDQLDMAGKRASLRDLNQRLLAIEGVHDGVVFALDKADALGVHRLAALVVAPGLDEADILRALRARFDPVFVPRRLRKVASLPRNATGKLPRQALLALLESD